MVALEKAKCPEYAHEMEYFPPLPGWGLVVDYGVVDESKKTYWIKHELSQHATVELGEMPIQPLREWRISLADGKVELVRDENPKKVASWPYQL